MSQTCEGGKVKRTLVNNTHKHTHTQRTLSQKRTLKIRLAKLFAFCTKALDQYLLSSKYIQYVREITKMDLLHDYYELNKM